MFRVLFAPIIRSTTAAYSHRYVYLWKREVMVAPRDIDVLVCVCHWICFGTLCSWYVVSWQIVCVLYFVYHTP
jgi:hypothetical protein